MKELNKNQAKTLFRDILNGNVKRLGQFKINKYQISLYTNTDTNSQRVMALYNRRKEKGLCVSCGNIKVEKYVSCKMCRERHNSLRRKRNYGHHSNV